METGPFIKLQRIKQGMTQEDLAEGIVSMSYLSKIENQKTSASQEVISLLCTRLGVQRDDDKEVTIKEKCQEWYDLLFETNDKEVITEKYEELERLLSNIHSDNLILFEIHRIRYYLVLADFEKALEQVNKLNEISNTFDTLHQFYWYKFKGNYISFQGEFSQAMRMYKLAEEKLNQISLDEAYVADLQYTIGITHSKLRNTLEAIEYANKALDIFQIKYNFYRCAQCHILLGISHRRISVYDKAIKNFNLALHLAKLSKNNQLMQLTNQNLGSLYSSKGESKEAIKYFRAIVDDEEVHLIERLAAITSLLAEQYNIYNYDDAKKMVDYGFKLLEKFKRIEEYKLFYYIINTYQYALESDHEKFENILIQEFIPYLKKHKDHVNLAIYAKMLGNHYEKLYIYKEATKYFKLANYAYDQLTIL
ncbi:helix-turn-helix domain-containing protein [Virgibacillus necropolis]|uniref:Transcriptional regulator n=1 Tax=Virgibacillus necropolis TaxID=163877 RepID=A0A221MH59_9BACI|nr:helix-turn-helix domain-containing protein [Virgibacillus necropolis]ASN06993.1 transcriptional regulator [Virgibacillus necropolis]